MKRYGYLVAVITFGALALAVANIPPNPCPPDGGDDLYFGSQKFYGCRDMAGYCNPIWAWNYRYEWTCDVWCCYDSEGQLVGKLINNCTPAECEYDGNCCRNLISCLQARADFINTFPCPTSAE